MPALLKLTRSIENLRDSFRSQPPTYDKKKNYVYKRVLGRGTFGKVLHAVWHDPGGTSISSSSSSSSSNHHQHPYPARRKETSASTRTSKKHQHQVQVQVALKVVKKSNLKRGDKNMVFEEVDVLKRLDHLNVLRFYEFFESCRNYYISFEYAAGGELFERIKVRGGRFGEGEARGCVRSILNGVAYLHSIGIVHHDLKPENILFRSKAPDSEVVLADFGAARHIDSPSELLFCDTGTYDYSPPEIFTREGHGTKLDMWAVGVITHAILSGMMPFPNHTLSILKTSILRCELAFDGRCWGGVSESAKKFIGALVNPDQMRRLAASEALLHPWIRGGGGGVGEEPREESLVSSSVELGTPLREKSKSKSKSELEKSEITSEITKTEETPIEVAVFPTPTNTSSGTRSVPPDLPGLRLGEDSDNNHNRIGIARARARERWRVVIGGAIAVGRFCEAGRRGAETRMGRGRGTLGRGWGGDETREREREGGEEEEEEKFGYEGGEELEGYDCDDSEFTNHDMSMISLALASGDSGSAAASAVSLASLASASDSASTSDSSSGLPSLERRNNVTSTTTTNMTNSTNSSLSNKRHSRKTSLVEEANSPERLRELERLVASGKVESARRISSVRGRGAAKGEGKGRGRKDVFGSISETSMDPVEFCLDPTSLPSRELGAEAGTESELTSPDKSSSTGVGLTMASPSSPSEQQVRPRTRARHQPEPEQPEQQPLLTTTPPPGQIRPSLLFPPSRPRGKTSSTSSSSSSSSSSSGSSSGSSSSSSGSSESRSSTYTFSLSLTPTPSRASYSTAATSLLSVLDVGGGVHSSSRTSIPTSTSTSASVHPNLDACDGDTVTGAKGKGKGKGKGREGDVACGLDSFNFGWRDLELDPTPESSPDPNSNSNPLLASSLNPDLNLNPNHRSKPALPPTRTQKPILSIVTSPSSPSGTSYPAKLGQPKEEDRKEEDRKEEDTLDQLVGWQLDWRTSLSELSPELEMSLRSFKERW